MHPVSFQQATIVLSLSIQNCSCMKQNKRKQNGGKRRRRRKEEEEEEEEDDDAWRRN